MNEPSGARNELEVLGRECAVLRADMAAQSERIRSLERELFDTNRGVLALYAELDDKAEQLRQVSDLKSRFLSYVSHEFRAPLASMRSITRLLLDHVDGPLSAEQEKQVLLVQRSAEELTEMVDDQLDLAKIEAGRLTISPEWFEMVDLFAALRGMFRPILLRENVNLRFEEPVDVTRLFTDHGKLAQILRNLIANALKFTHQGEVVVSARRHRDDHVRFTVADTGVGIPADVLPTLFQDFMQVASPAQRGLRGTGLGLALSKRFAQLLGGDLSVESQLGIGSTFSLTIPEQLPLAPPAT